MSAYRAFQVTGQRQFELLERELLEPDPGHVRLRVQTCGVCHTDFVAAEGMRPDPSRPVVPGHEVVGAIDAVGDGVTEWEVGDRVGVGFLGGHCGVCAWCRRGDFVNCANQPQTGTTVDGGYAEVMYARESGLVRIPDAMSAVDAAPLLCAGITTYNALVGLNAGPDALVAIQGIGGLGHLGCNTRTRWVTAWPRSLVAPTRPCWRKSSAPITTSTARLSIPPPLCRNSAGPPRSSPRRPAARRCRRWWQASRRAVN